MVDKHYIIPSISELSPINVPNYISIPSSLRLVLCPPHCACNDVNHFCPHLIRHVGVFHLGLRGLNYHSSSAICNNLPNKLKNKHAVCHQKIINISVLLQYKYIYILYNHTPSIRGSFRLIIFSNVSRPLRPLPGASTF